MNLLAKEKINRVCKTDAAAAAAKATPEQIAALELLTAKMEATENSSDISDLDAQFHQAICDASGNSTLTALVGLFRSRGRHFNVLDSVEGTEVHSSSNKGHRAIREAIRDHDPAAAGTAAAAAHVAQTEFWLKKHRPEPDPGK